MSETEIKFNEETGSWELPNESTLRIRYDGFSICKVDLGDGEWRKAEKIRGETPSGHRFAITWDSETLDCKLETADAEPVGSMIIQGQMENRNLVPRTHYELQLKAGNPLVVTERIEDKRIWKVILFLALLVALACVLEAAKITNFLKRRKSDRLSEQSQV